MTILTKDQIGGAVAFYIGCAFDSQREAARTLGITQPEVSRAIEGKIVRPEVLAAMGLEQVTIYQSVEIQEAEEEQSEMELPPGGGQKDD